MSSLTALSSGSTSPVLGLLSDLEEETDCTFAVHIAEFILEYRYNIPPLSRSQVQQEQ